MLLTKETKSGITQATILVVKPSAAEWSDIPQLQYHNRGANEPKGALDDLYKAIKDRGRIVTDLKGYLENKRLYITAGSRRLAVAQALESEGVEILLPVALIAKPESDEEIREAIADNLSDNNFRKADSPQVLYDSFKGLRDLGWSLTDIGESTGFSHTQVAWYLKTFEVPVLKKAILADEISPRAASDFITEAYKKIDPKTKKPAFTVVKNDEGKNIKKYIYDEEKIATKLKEEKAKANAAGKGKVGGKSHKASKGLDGDIRGMKAVRIILDEPEDNVPHLFRLFCRWLNADEKLTNQNFKAMAKKNGFLDEIEWLFDIEFNADARKVAKEKAKADKDKAKASKASKAKKDDPTIEDEELDAEDYE